jgi:D-alanyl-D-alanine carboxypeptidase/D-alanyl-D-alanine-endopeptidase (penicillin-binding protein 4)
MKSKSRKLTAALLLTLLLTGSVFADLAGRIDSIINKDSQKGAIYAVQVMNADTGQVVYTHNANKPMTPASNMKVVTSAAATKFLGPNYEYTTCFALQENNLVVIGSGDPLLGDEKTNAKYNHPADWILNDIAEKLKQQQISEINDIIIDTGIFDNQPVHPNWPANDLNKWWACEVCGLNYNGNCIAVTVTNDKGKAVINIEPRTSYVNIINKVTVADNGSGAVGAYRVTGNENTITIKGKCTKQEGPFDVAIERPPLFFAHLLSEKLNSQGIKTKGLLLQKVLDPQSEIRVIAVYQTNISDCLARCNKDSFGLVAESLLKTIAAKKNGFQAGSWTGGQKIISEYLLSLGIKQDEFKIDDGSGLSRENKLSANALTKVLYDTYKSDNWQVYRGSLAVGGIDGTIDKYFKQDKFKGKVIGKTGYISGVRSFSGFCFTDNGNFVFSIITSSGNGQTRDEINNIVKEIFN